jgi:hypothetical protein
MIADTPLSELLRRGGGDDDEDGDEASEDEASEDEGDADSYADEAGSPGRSEFSFGFIGCEVEPEVCHPSPRAVCYWVAVGAGPWARRPNNQHHTLGAFAVVGRTRGVCWVCTCVLSINNRPRRRRRRCRSAATSTPPCAGRAATGGRWPRRGRWWRAARTRPPCPSRDGGGRREAAPTAWPMRRWYAPRGHPIMRRNVVGSTDLNLNLRSWFHGCCAPVMRAAGGWRHNA